MSDEPFNTFAGRPMYYDVFGNPLTLMQWAHLIERRDNKLYGILAQDDFEIDGHNYWISTVWLGLDHNWWPEGEPLIFETAIFDCDDTQEFRGRTVRQTVDIYRWSSLDQAYQGHDLVKRSFVESHRATY